jgi:predicted tellurium resistance membrane protein TerC
MKTWKSRLMATCSIIGGVVIAAPAFAVDASLDTLFAAADVTGLQAKTLLLLTGAIAMPLLFVGYDLLKKGIKRYRG